MSSINRNTQVLSQDSDGQSSIQVATRIDFDDGYEIEPMYFKVNTRGKVRIQIYGPDYTTGAGNGPDANWIWDVFGVEREDGNTVAGSADDLVGDAAVWLARFGHEAAAGSNAQLDVRWAGAGDEITLTDMGITPAASMAGLEVVIDPSDGRGANEFRYIRIQKSAHDAADDGSTWYVTASLVDNAAP